MSHLLKGEKDYIYYMISVKQNIVLLYIVFFYRFKQVLIDIGDAVVDAVP